MEPFVTFPYSWESNIISKKAGPDLGFYTPLVFPVILCYTYFNFWGIFGRKLIHFLQSCRKMEFESNNVVASDNPIVTHKYK